MAKNDNQWGEKLPAPPQSTGKYRKASALEDGQSITGTILAFRTQYSEQLKKELTSIVMKEGDEEFELSPSGTINDAIRAGMLKVGQRYKFQKEGLTKTKKGQYKGVFGIYPAKNSASSNIGDTEV